MAWLDHCQIRESYSRALEQGPLMYRELGWSADTIWYRGGRRLIGNWVWPQEGRLINPLRPSPDPEVAAHVRGKRGEWQHCKRAWGPRIKARAGWPNRMLHRKVESYSWTWVGVTLIWVIFPITLGVPSSCPAAHLAFLPNSHQPKQYSEGP